ncbi:nose resistant to fluoxetine protein 6-like [Bradysia coprophila]|uniref:nose resistant to fluoxetine protein 6-like n=1 Tax=Bradysia coprophila TaxID=38358 RepID=UPI00187D8DF3|nr:nose resistant to fluoxetine protein 6-like [Bradysia coprophila]
MERFAILVTMLVCSWPALNGDVNMTEYYKMPPIFELEDYDLCMEEFPNHKNIYCYTRTQIKPNEKSELWLYMQSFSSNVKRHFRHDRLNRGICMNWCIPKVKSFARSTQREYYVERFDNNSEITYDPNSIQNALSSKVKYDKEINICVNYKLKKQYGLMAYSEVEYCLTNADYRLPDALDIVLAIVFFALILIVATSTYFDFRLKLQNFGCNRNSEHYKNPVHGPYASVVVSFSIPRNWYRLTAKVHSQTSDDLRPVQALRFLTMFGVVIGHCVLFMNVMPLYNPEYMEKNFYRVVTMFLVNGTTIIQTFFVISGYLLSIQFVKLQETSSFSFKYFWTSILYRYLRLTPVYLFIILFHSTWLVWLQNGPLWPHITETERTYCRNNWWANLLYINNIFTLSEPCLQHGWYLAADFQMFVVGVVMQLLFWKYPRCKKFVLSAAILISAVIPGVITYVNRYDGAFMIRPEADRYSHYYDDMYRNVYVPSYMNFGSFVCGMIGGMVYNKFKDDYKKFSRKTTLVILWYSMIPFAILLLLSAFIFYENNFVKPAIWIALYAAVIRNLWGFLLASFITGVAFGLGWIIKDTMSHPIFRFLGRLTFCAYLIHPAIIRLCIGNIRQPTYASDMTIAVQVFSVFVLSYGAALLLCLGIELPSSALQRHFAGGQKNNDNGETSTSTEDYQIHPNIELK